MKDTIPWTEWVKDRNVEPRVREVRKRVLDDLCEANGKDSVDDLLNDNSRRMRNWEGLPSFRGGLEYLRVLRDAPSENSFFHVSARLVIIKFHVPRDFDDSGSV